jgi:hypothetical protein
MDSRHDDRQRWQFGLQSLFVVTALMAGAFAIARYWIDGPEVIRLVISISFGVLIAVNLVIWIVSACWFVILRVAERWNKRSTEPTFDGLAARTAIFVGIVCFSAMLLLRWPFDEALRP